MPEYATFHNTICDIKCSKCKKTQDHIYNTQHGKDYKTCNECRGRAKTKRGIQLRNSLSPERRAILARYDDSAVNNAANEVVVISYSTAAVSTSIVLF